MARQKGKAVVVKIPAPATPGVDKARRYEAGSRFPRLSSWVTPSTDATAAIDHPQQIRNRARDLVRNNPWAAKGIAALVNNAVGYGIRCQIQSKSKVRAKQAQDLWSAWAETTACDADGQHDFYGLQQIAFRALAESGECLIRLRPRRPDDKLPIPFQIQVLEPDLIADGIASTTLVQLMSGTENQVIRGIEYDPLGRRVAYYLYKVHPGALVINLSPGFYTRVPAEEVIHLYRTDRPGQNRGVSWLAPVIVRLRELQIYEDAYLKRQQLANLFAGFLISEDPNEFEGELNNELPDLQPGTMYALKPGSRIEFTNPPPAGEDPRYRDSCLRSIAAGLGITYEALTGNLAEVNFSSARMGAHEMGRNIDSWLWNLFIPRMCAGVFEWFKNAIDIQGVLATSDLIATWTPPARTIVDPNKEYSALETAVRCGLMSLPEAIRQQGFDPDQVLTEQAEFLKKLDAAGVVVDTDPRMTLVKMAPPPTTPTDQKPANKPADQADSKKGGKPKAGGK